jgi:hypothetical protein
LHNYFNFEKNLIKNLMEEEGGAKVGYSLDVHSSNELSRTLNFFSYCGCSYFVFQML